MNAFEKYIIDVETNVTNMNEISVFRSMVRNNISDVFKTHAYLNEVLKKQNGPYFNQNYFKIKLMNVTRDLGKIHKSVKGLSDFHGIVGLGDIIETDPGELKILENFNTP